MTLSSAALFAVEWILDSDTKPFKINVIIIWLVGQGYR